MFPKVQNVSYKDHIVNEDVIRKSQAAIGKYNAYDLGQEMETEGACQHLKVFWHSKDNSIGHSEMKKKKT